MLGKVFVGDPLQLDHGNPRDILQSVSNQPAIVEAAEAMLKPVIKGAKQERPADQAAAKENPREEKRGCFSQ